MTRDTRLPRPVRRKRGGYPTVLANVAPTRGTTVLTIPGIVLARPKYRASRSAGANSGTIIIPETR